MVTCYFQIKLYNLNFGINEKIEYMGWVNEGVLNNNHPWQSYCARFMIIRGRDVLLFDTPPVSVQIFDTFIAIEVSQSVCNHIRVIPSSINFLYD